MTWESRVRGSAGWLPLDYLETRRVPMPGQVEVQPLPISHPLLGPPRPAPAPQPAQDRR
jgi:hypothetical protein